MTVHNSTNRLNRPARPRSMQLGDLAINYVPDGYVQLRPRAWLPRSTDEDWDELVDHLDETGNLVASIGSLLVRLGDRALLIDAGLGPYKVPDEPGNPHAAGVGGALLDNLEAVGCPAGAIEAIAFTHLHIDHVGWAWSPAPGSSAPAFTSARYLVTEQEWARHDLIVEAGTSPEALDVMAGRVTTTVDGQEIFPGVRLRVAPGHTSGHATYEITSAGKRMIVFGDLMHTPVQVAHPEWTAASDLDRVESMRHRVALLDDLRRSDTIGFGVHFADVPFGRVEGDPGNLRWVPVD